MLRSHNVLFWLLAAALFVFTFLEYRPWKGYDTNPHVDLGTEPIRIAYSLLHDGEFANPFGARATGPTAHIAPGFPFVQMLVLKAFGEARHAWLALQILPVLVLAIELAILPYMARTMGFSPWTGALGAAFGLITKPGSEPQWEAQLAGLFVCLLLLSACHFVNREGRWGVIATGAVASITFYFQPVCVVPYLAWVITVPRRNGLRKNVLLLVLIPLGLCAPWCIRNYLDLGTFGMRDNFGIEMYVSFNDCAPYSFQESLQRLCISSLHPNSSRDEAAQLATLGEYQYNRVRLQEALSWISRHPARAMALITERAWFFWFPSATGLAGYQHQRWRTVFLHLLTLLSFTGFFFDCKTQRSGLLALWLGFFPIIYCPRLGGLKPSPFRRRLLARARRIKFWDGGIPQRRAHCI